MEVVPQEKEHIPRVIDGKLQHISVSSGKELSSCERAWWFASVKRIKAPKTKSQDMGTAGHAQLEHTVRTGQDVLGPIARPALAHIPPREVWPELWVEEQIQTLDKLRLAGVPLTGGLDLVWPAKNYLRDYKFTSDLKWALTPAQAAEDIQLGVYSHVLFRTLDAEYIDAGLIYLQTYGAHKALPVPATITVDKAQRAVDTLTQRAERMHSVAKVTNPADLQPTLGSCFKYHKTCAYWAQCPLSMAERLKAESLKDKDREPKEEKSTVASPLLEKMKKKDSAPPPTAVAVATPAPTEGRELQIGDSYKLVSGAVAKFLGPDEEGRLLFDDGKGRIRITSLSVIKERVTSAAPAAPAADPPAAQAAVVFDPRSIVPADAPKHTEATAALPLPSPVEEKSPGEDKSALSPAKPKRKQLTDAERAEIIALKAAGMSQKDIAVKMGVSQPAVSHILRAASVGNDAVPTTTVVPPTPPPAPIAEIQHLPARTPEFLAKSAELADKLADEPIPPKFAEALLETVGAPKPSVDFVLYVNCRPTRTPAQDLAPWIYELAKKTAADAGAIDVRLSDNKMLAFGKWEATLGLRALESPPTGAWFCYRTSLTNPVIEALSSIAKEVIL